MPDVKEVFETTTRTTRPEPGALQRQHGRQHRHAAKRRAGGYAVAAAIVAIAVGAAALVARTGDGDGTSITQPPTLEPGFYLVDTTDGSIGRFPLGQEGSWWYQYSPDRTQVLFVRIDANDHDQVFRMDADGTSLEQLTTNPYGATHPTWSPGGRRIAYTAFAPDGSREIYVLDLETRVEDRITHEASDAIDPTWSPDGTQITFAARIPASEPQTFSGDWVEIIRTVDLATREVRPLIGNTARAAWAMSWSPDGDEFAFTWGYGTEGTVAVAHADGGQPREIAMSPSDWPLWSPDGSRIAYNLSSDDLDSVAVWLYDVSNGENRLLIRDVIVESWRDDGTLLVSHPDDHD